MYVHIYTYTYQKVLVNGQAGYLRQEEADIADICALTVGIPQSGKQVLCLS
jgi:hypothetical protein